MTTAALGSLVVSLEANIAKFSADMGRAAYVAEKSMAQVASAASAAQTALIGLGGAAIVAGITNMVRESLALASALDDLADTTGSSVEGLSRLANVAKVSGVSFNDMAAVLGKFAANLNGIDEESTKAARALRFLGVESKDPATALQHVADALIQYADGAGKAAVARDLFGKNGPQFLAYLKDLATEQGIVATVTGQTAAEAEKLEKETKKLGLTMDAWAGLLSGKVASALNEYIERLKLAREAGLGWWKSSDLATTTDEGIDRRVKSVTEKIDELNKRLEAGRREGFGLWVQDAMEKLGPLKAELGVLLGLKAQLQQGANGDKFDRYLRGEQGAPPGTFKPLDYSSGTGGGKSGPSAFAEQMKALQAASHAVTVEIEAQVKAFQKQQAAAMKAADEIVKSREAILDSYDRSNESLQTSIEQLEFQARTFGMTNEQLLRFQVSLLDAAIAQEKLNIALADDQGMTPEYLRRIQDRIDLLEREKKVKLELAGLYSGKEATDAMRASASAAAAEWQKTADTIQASLTDALLRGFESGKDFATNFRDTLRNLFNTLILRPVIQAIVSPVAGAMAGMFPTGASAKGVLGGAGGGDLLSGLASGGGMFNLFGAGPVGAGSLFGAGGLAGAFSGAGGIMGAGGALNGFALSGAGQALGLSSYGVGASAGMAGELALTGLGSTLGAALPILGIALAAYFMFKKPRGGPKTGGASNNIPGLEDFFTPNQADAEANALASTTLARYDQLVRSFGGSGSALFDFGFDSDPQGKASDRIRSAVSVNGNLLYDTGNIETGRDSAATQAAMELAAKRALLAALQASELPADIAALFDGIVAQGATAEQVDQLLAFGTAMGTVTEALRGLEDIDVTIAKLDQGPLEVLRDMGTELLDLAANFDGSVESTNALSQATAGYYDAMVRTIAQIRQIKTGLDEMFAGTSQSIYLAQRSPEFVNRYLQARGDELFGLVSSSSDPASINRWAQEFNAVLQQSFGLRTPEQQIADRQSFLDAIAEFNRLVDERLTAIDADTRSNGRNVLEVASETISDAAADMKAGGQASLAAGELQLVAAQTPLHIVIDTGTGEVGVRP